MSRDRAGLTVEERAAVVTQYLQIAISYADAALDCGADPDSVFLNVWGQLENYRIAVIDDGDSEALLRREMEDLRRRHKQAIDKLDALFDVLQAKLPRIQRLERAEAEISVIRRLLAGA